MSAKVVNVGSFGSPWEATTAKALLEVRGIPSVLVNAEVANLFGPLNQSFIDPVQLEVAAEHRAEAQRLIDKLKSARTEQGAHGASIAEPETCLKCGATMQRGEERCGTCGWSYAEEETTGYENGPVPDSLLGYVHSPRDSRRFALPAAAAKRYAHWCQKEGLEVRGWEVWLPNMATHSIAQIRDRGDARAFLQAIPAAVATFGPNALFCVNVVTGAPADGGRARGSATKEAEADGAE